jgi:hypothetical protein
MVCRNLNFKDVINEVSEAVGNTLLETEWTGILILCSSRKLSVIVA